jgi:hypothetical protein
MGSWKIWSRCFADSVRSVTDSCKMFPSSPSDKIPPRLQFSSPVFTTTC